EPHGHAAGLPGLRPAHAGARLRANRQHRVPGHVRLPVRGRGLLREQGRRGLADEVAGRGVGTARGERQRHRPLRLPHRPQSQAHRAHAARQRAARAHAPAPLRTRGGAGGSGRLPGLGRGQLRERPRAGRGRRGPGQRGEPMSTAGAVTPSPALGRPGRYRWMICALLFFGTTINYIDRQVIGILKPTLVQQFGWQDERIYAAIVFTFQLRYAIGLLLAGRIMDKLGTRRGFAIAVGIWSVAAVGHAVAERMDWMKLPTINLDAKTGLSGRLHTRGAAGFAIMRFLLGLGEAGNSPASIKTVAEWFPKKERALATGSIHAGEQVR